MSENKPTESVWSDIGPDELIPDSEVPERATEIERTVGNWLADNVQYLDPFDWRDQDEKYWRKKAFLEVGGYLLTAQAFGERDPAQELETLVVDRVNDQRFAHRMLRSPRKLHHFAAPVLYAKHVNALEPETEAAFERTVELGAFREFEWPAYRLIEFWLLSRLISQLFDDTSGQMSGETRDQYEIDTIIEYSQLNHQPNAVRSTLPHAYCLTHDVMFYNNVYGICDDAIANDPAPYDVSDLLQGLILRYMAADNCDIVLELVATGVLQRQISKDLVKLALSWVLEKVEGRGYVPGPDMNKVEVMNSLSSEAQDLGTGDQRWAYQTERERIWGENYHTTVVAGFTTRIIEEHWDELDERSGVHSLENPSFRHEVMQLGQVMESLGRYNLEGGAKQLTALAGSNVMTEYSTVARDAVDFLEDQRTGDGSFGFWTQEKTLYTRAGRSPESFQDELVEPVSQACREALKAVDVDDSA